MMFYLKVFRGAGIRY